MSSILRALKQAEKASSGQADKQDPSDRPHVLSRSNGLQPRRYALGPVTIFFLMIVIAGTGTALYVNFFVHGKSSLKTPGNPVSSKAPASPPAGIKDQIQQEQTPLRTADIPSGQQDDSTRNFTAPSKPSRSIPVISDSLTDESTPAVPSKSIPEISDRLTTGSNTVVQSEAVAGSVPVMEDPHDLKESAVISSVKNTPKERSSQSRKKLDAGRTNIKTDDAQAIESIPETPGDSIVSIDEGAGKDAETQEIQRLEDTPFRIQAISWSEDANRRIAVIDDRVLSEGDRVQKYRLITIEKDSVILRHKGKNYRLLFTYR